MNALIVGHGKMGRLHAKVLADLGYTVTTVDPDPAAGASHTQVPHVRFAVAVVACPIPHLAEQAAPLIERGIPTLIEKPMAGTSEDALELASLASRTGTRVTVGYVERFNPQVRALKGAPILRATFERWNDRPTMDPLLDLTSHDIDLARFLGVTDPVFDTRVCAKRRRRIVLEVGHVDLMDHQLSPLHAQAHAFLSGAARMATPLDAVAVLREVEQMREAVPLAA